MSDHRPNPDDLLKQVKGLREQSKRGRLKIFFGMCPGVGKTYAMLKAAQERQLSGVRLLVGVVETHQRVETEALLQNLPLLPRRKLEYAGAALEEFDLDAALVQKPELILVDELAHTNAPTSRHPKRYQDVEELLMAGIDVYTTINVQHIESRVDQVFQFTGITIREKVPDSFIERADELEIVDISPEQLLKRLREGKVYLGDRAERAAQNFFKEETLIALREVALRFTAEVIDEKLRGQMTLKGIHGPWNTNERLLVAISHSPFSARLVRATRRMAYNLEAPWVAVHVDTGVQLSPEDELHLKQNLDSARELGAEVISRKDISVPAAMMRVAREKNVTQMVMGRPDRRFFPDLFSGGTILDQLVNESSDIDIHVMRQKRPPRRVGFYFRLPAFAAPLSRYVKTSIYVALVGALNYLFLPSLGYHALGFVFLLSFLPVALLAGLGPTLLAAALSSLIWDFVFIPPQFTFAIHESQDAMMIFAYFGVALVVGVLAHRLRLQESSLIEREYRAGILYEFGKKLSSAASLEAITGHAAETIQQIFKIPSTVFLANATGMLSDKAVSGESIAFDDKDRAVAHWSFENKKIAGKGTDTLPYATCRCYPLTGRSNRVGVLVVYPQTTMPLNEENLLETIATNLAAALEREFLESSSRRMLLLEQSEKMHQTLLNSVSHELRTPLTSIIGVASAFAEPHSFQDDAYRVSLTHNLTESAERLRQTIDNILDMTRVSTGVLQIERNFFEMHDFIRSWVSRSKGHYPRHEIKFMSNGDDIYIRGDEKLLDSVFTNLVSNAEKYSPSGSKILIQLESRFGNAEIQVRDEGVGIPPGSLDKIFDRFFRAHAESKGLGLGLSIVKAIVEAHGGTIQAKNQIDQKGAIFTLLIPMQVLPREVGVLNE